MKYHQQKQFDRVIRKFQECMRRCRSLDERKLWTPPHTCFKGDIEGYHTRAPKQTAYWSRRHSRHSRQATKWLNKAIRMSHDK